MIDKMDRKLPQRHPLKKYRFYIAGGIVFVFLLGYIIFLSLRPKRLKIDSENIIITEVTATRFLEYMEVEGVTQPIVTIKLNTHGSGNVEKVLVEEGEMVNQGDTIFILYNNDLLRNIADQKADWEKQLITFREQEIEMEQKSLNLKQQTLQNRYDLERLRKSYELDKEEFQMGIKSRAQLQVAEDEYNYKMESARLQQENLRHDSAVSVIRRQLLNRELDRNRNKYLRAVESCADLVVTAPISGQLSFLNISPGQRVGAGESVGEIKVLEKFKIKGSVK